MNRRRTRRAVLKYVGLTVCGIVLFLVVHAHMSEVRGHGSPGGELFFPLLPVMWWLISQTAKDWAAELKNLHNGGKGK